MQGERLAVAEELMNAAERGLEAKIKARLDELRALDAQARRKK